MMDLTVIRMWSERALQTFAFTFACGGGPIGARELMSGLSI